MKKIIVAILVVCMAIFAFASCGDEEIKSYTVTFDTDGGTTVAAQTVEEGKLATQPADPTKEGCTFTGWTVNGAAFNFTKGITADVTVKATWSVNDYTVTFDTDGGSELAPVSVPFGTPVKAPAAPTKEGYTFAGWFVGETAYDFTKPVMENVTVKAAWTLNDYTVDFDTDGGSAVESVGVSHGATVTKPEDPTKEGYIFAGWFVGEEAFDFDAPVTSDVTVKAAWTLITYEVIFDTDGAEPIEGETVNYGGTATKPADPTKVGYTFAGWTVNGEAFDFATVLTGDVTITATWTEITYTVTVDTDNGAEATTETVKFGGTATKPADPTKAGYYFMGWTVEGAAYDFATVLTGDITVKAEWLEIPDLTAIAGTWTGTETVVSMTNSYEFVIAADGTVTASYNNGYTDVVMTVNYVKLEGNTFTVNYTAGSTEGADMVFTVSDDKGTLTTDSAAGTYALTLYKTLTVTFDWGNYKNEVDPTVKTVKYGETVTAATKSWTGYEIKYWLNGEAQFDFATPITTDMTLVAHWDVKMIEVNFVGQDGTTVVATTTVPYNTPYGELTIIPETIPTTDGYKFNGLWYSSITGTSPVSATSKITSAKTYYPGLIAPMTEIDGKWVGTDSKGTTYTVVVNAAEQTVAITTVNGETTTELDIKSVLFKLFETSTPATKLVVRYLTAGSTNETTLTLTYTEDKTFTGSNSLTLNKEIEGAKTYTVTIDADNGTEPATQTVVEGATATKPADPTKEGFTFAGWFVGEDAYDFTAAVNGDITVVAKWTEAVVPEEYTVTFNLDGGRLTSLVTEQTVTAGTVIEKPTSDPTKSGNNFLGWFVGDVEYDFTAPVTADITITAKWELKPQTVTFLNQDGTVCKEIIVRYGEYIPAEEVPTTCTVNEGFAFTGAWHTSSTVTSGLAKLEDQIKSDKTFYPGVVSKSIKDFEGTWVGNKTSSSKSDDYVVVFAVDENYNVTVTITHTSTAISTGVVTEGEVVFTSFQFDGSKMCIKYTWNGSSKTLTSTYDAENDQLPVTSGPVLSRA